MYVGHQRPTSGTTIVDVADPSNPRLLARIDMPDGWHSHKVRVCGDIMIVNHEKFGKAGRSEIGGGIAIYDVARPSEPKQDPFRADPFRVTFVADPITSGGALVFHWPVTGLYA